MPLPVEGFEISELARLEIASRRELFVDHTVVDALLGSAHLQLHRPVPREVVLICDAPWEGSTCAYASIFRDAHAGGIVRMYYRGSGSVSAFPPDGSTPPSAHRAVTCYAESSDGVHWAKPDLGLVAFNGSTANNIIWDGTGSHNFVPFLDANPRCAEEAKYKALAGTIGEGGLFALGSPDGIRWSLLQADPIITQGTFDSQNLAFWDTYQGQYRAYVRDFRKPDGSGGDFNGIRDIRTCTSDDFIHWTEPRWLTYAKAGTIHGPATAVHETHLYTNQVLPYFRAPHIYIGFPARFLPDRESMTEGLLMTSRDGRSFSRWEEAFLPPGPNPNRWHNRSNYVWWGMVETASAIMGAEPEISLYANENYYKAGPTRLRRYTIRRDGFVSVSADLDGGQLLTKPLTFAGAELRLNVATSAAGDVRVGLERPGGQPIPGLALDDCVPFYGDTSDHKVVWHSDGNLAALAGHTVRLRIALRDADLYAVQVV